MGFPKIAGERVEVEQPSHPDDHQGARALAPQRPRQDLRHLQDRPQEPPRVPREHVGPLPGLDRGHLGLGAVHGQLHLVGEEGDPLVSLGRRGGRWHQL